MRVCVCVCVGTISTKCTHTHTHSLIFCSDWGEIPMTARAVLDGYSMTALVSDDINMALLWTMRWRSCADWLGYW